MAKIKQAQSPPITRERLLEIFSQPESVKKLIFEVCKKTFLPSLDQRVTDVFYDVSQRIGDKCGARKLASETKKEYAKRHGPKEAAKFDSYLRTVEDIAIEARLYDGIYESIKDFAKKAYPNKSSNDIMGGIISRAKEVDTDAHLTVKSKFSSHIINGYCFVISKPEGKREYKRVLDGLIKQNKPRSEYKTGNITYIISNWPTYKKA